MIETRLNRVFFESLAKPCLTRKCIVLQIFRMPISRQWLFLCNMASKTIKQISAIEQGKLLSAILGREFLEVEGKGYRSMIRKKKNNGTVYGLTNQSAVFRFWTNQKAVFGSRDRLDLVGILEVWDRVLG